MAAGLGFKTFNTGDVLTAGDTNGYLMQGVWVFANATARTSAVTSPQEGNVSFLKDTNSLEIYDGSAWVAYGSGDITGVTAGTGISGGGTSGTVTVTNSMATTIDAKGDLIVGTGDNTFERLPIGSNNQILTADSSASGGVKWATAAASAKVVQVVYAELTTTATTTSSSFTDTGVTASITPTSASNNILVIVSLPLSMTTGSHQGWVTLTDGSDNNLCNASSPGSRIPAFEVVDGDQDSAAYGLRAVSFTKRHSPATTSSFTYKIRWKSNGSATLALNRFAGADTDSSGYGRGVATITLLEIAP